MGIYVKMSCMTGSNDPMSGVRFWVASPERLRNAYGHMLQADIKSREYLRVNDSKLAATVNR